MKKSEEINNEIKSLNQLIDILGGEGLLNAPLPDEQHSDMVKIIQKKETLIELRDEILKAELHGAGFVYELGLSHSRRVWYVRLVKLIVKFRKVFGLRKK